MFTFLKSSKALKFSMYFELDLPHFKFSLNSHVGLMATILDSKNYITIVIIVSVILFIILFITKCFYHVICIIHIFLLYT